MGKDKTDKEKIDQKEKLNEEEVLGMLKQLLLKLFRNDKDVQDSLISVTSKEQNNAQLIKEKETEIQKLNEDIKEKEKTIKSLDKNLTDQKHRLEEIEQKSKITENALSQAKKEIDAVTSEKKRISGELEEIKHKYESMGELEDIYHAYNKLPRDLKDSMAGFIRGDSLISFVISGARDSRIEKFWEFCRIEVQKSNGLEYSKEIASIFSFFFTKINGSVEPSLYELIIPPKGAKFDEDSMTPSNNSPSKSGVVDGVVLPGYKGMNTGKVIKKTIVTLKG